MPTRTRRPPDKHPVPTLNTKSAGQILRDERLRQNLTINEVSQAIKVRPSILEAIEDGHFFGLTDPLYLKGFIRAYTRHLGLADDQVMPFFRREYDEQEQQQKPPQPLKPIDTKPKKVSPAWVIGGIAIVTVITILGYAYYQYITFALLPTLMVETPQDGLTTDRPLTQVTGHTDPDATLTINGQTVQTDPTGGFRIAVGLSDGSNNLTVTAKNKLGKSSTITRTVIVPPTTATRPTLMPTVLAATTSANLTTLPNQSSPSATPTPLTTEIRLTIGPASASVRVQVDNQTTFDGVLLPGASKLFTGNKISIKTQNAGSTHLVVNGQDQGAMGPDNAEIERTYP